MLARSVNPTGKNKQTPMIHVFGQVLGVVFGHSSTLAYSCGAANR